MTIMNGQDGLKVYVGDGATAAFPVPFTFRHPADISVTRRTTLADVPLALGADYTISGDGLAGSASVVLLATPALGEKIIIDRYVPARQEQALTVTGEFPSVEVEKVLDDLARATGDTQRLVDRAIKFDVETADGQVLPQASERANTLIGFDEHGNLDLPDRESFKGDPGYVNASGPLASRVDYDDEGPAFTFLATDQTPHVLFWRETDVSGVWSSGTPYGRGEIAEIMSRDWGNAIGTVPTNLIDASILSGMMPFGVPQPWPYGGALPDARFIELWGGTIGKEGSGADYVGDDFRDYYELCRDTPAFGNSGDEEFDALDTVKSLDMRGGPFVGCDANLAGDARNVLQRSTTITTTAASVDAIVASTSGLAIGMYVLAAAVPVGTTIADVGTGGAITLSAAADDDATDQAARFSYFSDPEQPGGFAGELVHKILQQHLPAYALPVTDTGHLHGVDDPGHAHGKSGDSHGHGDNLEIGGSQAGGIIHSFSTISRGVDGSGGSSVIKSVGWATTTLTITGGVSAAASGISISSATTGITVTEATTGVTVASGGGAQNIGIQTPAGTARWIAWARRVSIAAPSAFGIDGRYYRFNPDTAQGDPGNGYFRLNHANPMQATQLYIDNEDSNGHQLADFLDTWDAGRIEIIGLSDPGSFVLYRVTAAAVDATGYRLVGVQAIGGSNAFALDSGCAILQLPGGAEGPQGPQGIQGDVGAAGLQGVSGLEPVISGISATSLTIGAGTKVFTTQSGVAWTSGQRLRASCLADPTNYMEGLVADYSADQLTLDVSMIGGAGTFADWSVAIVGAPGAGAVDSVQGLTGGVVLNATSIGALRGITVRVATTTNITIATALNDGDTQDGVTLETGDLVQVGAQTAPEENGIIVVGVTPARVAEFSNFDQHPSMLVTVQEGTLNGGTLFVCVSPRGGTLDTDPIDFLDLWTAMTPAGEITENYAETAHPGWINLDGSTISDGALDNPRCAARYPWMVSGDDLKLTDRRGKFDRVWNDGAGADPDTASRTGRAGDGQTGDYPGTEQETGAPGITGAFSINRFGAGGNMLADDTGALFIDAAAGTSYTTTTTASQLQNRDILEFDASNSPASGAAAYGAASEIRPVNHYVCKQMRLG